MIQRNTVHSVDPNKGDIFNLGVLFHEDMEENEEPDIVEPSDIFEFSTDACTLKSKNSGHCTNKHKQIPVFHDTHEHLPNKDDLQDSKEQIKDSSGIDTLTKHKDFGPKVTADDMPQSHPAQRKKLDRHCKRAHLMTAAACLSLANAHSLPVLDSGQNLPHLDDSTCFAHDLFLSDSVAHVLETDFSP